MRRKTFIQLAGVKEEAFKLLWARGHVPFSPAPGVKGWNEFSVRDLVAFEAAGALVRLGVGRAEARRLVELYLPLAIEWGAEGGGVRGIRLGAAAVVALKDGETHFDSFHELIGSMDEIAEQLRELTVALPGGHWVDGVFVCNLALCVESIIQRAGLIGFQDDQLDQLRGAFQ